jgi:4'-phosphopantetheinyl transferase
MVVLWSRIHAGENAGENESLLSYAERARAARFATDDLRRRYVAAHAFVRRALAAHTGADAAALRFDAGAFGKPQLIDFPQVHFNLSHSGDWALCVISDDGPVGVDIEVVRPLDEHAAEYDALVALSEEQQVFTFFEIWTKKEAYVKATGRGLAQPLQDFSVPISAGHETVQPEGRWRVRAIEAPTGYAAAICTAAPTR